MLRGNRKRANPATVLSALALIFAMTGGAYAAGRYVITSAKQIKPSVLRQLKGKAGARGPAGPAGVAGPAGAAGSAAVGKEGPAGKEGTPGKDGARGETGPRGPQGEPWVPDGTLPSGAAETGVWGLSKLSALPGLGQVHIPISFTIPLAAPLDGNHVHVIEEGEEGAAGKGCGGGSSKEPTAEPGNLCVYIANQSNAGASAFALQNMEIEEEGAGKTGADLQGLTLEEGSAARGEWVVRAGE